MASIPMVLHRLRRTRRRDGAAESATQFDEYRPAYEETLRVAQELGGEDALDAVSSWAIEYTKR